MAFAASVDADAQQHTDLTEQAMAGTAGSTHSMDM